MICCGKRGSIPTTAGCGPRSYGPPLTGKTATGVRAGRDRAVPRVISRRSRPRRGPGAKRYDLGAACHNLLHHQIAGQEQSPGWPHGVRRHQSSWPLGGQSMARARLARVGRGLVWRVWVAGSALALAAAAGAAAAPPASAGVGTAMGPGVAGSGTTAGNSGATAGNGTASGNGTIAESGTAARAGTAGGNGTTARAGTAGGNGAVGGDRDA